jgi:hypothetical protein
MSQKSEIDPCAGNPVQPDWCAMYQALLKQIGGPVMVETPQLGRVEFARPSELYQALQMLRMEAARAAGTATAGVFVVGYDRGLWPTKGCVQ